MPKPKLLVHQTFPDLIRRLRDPSVARMVKIVGESVIFICGVDTVHAWGQAMVRLGLASNASELGNPYDFIPGESGLGRRSFHEALLFIIPQIKSEAELVFMWVLVNETNIPKTARASIENAWLLQVRSLGLEVIDHPIDFENLPEEVRLFASGKAA